MDPALRIFLLGVAGSAAVEVVQILRSYESGRPLPARYRKKGYWVARIVLALVGGIIAHAYSVDNGILAFHLGASAPLILENFGKYPPAGAIPNLEETESPSPTAQHTGDDKQR